MKKLTIALALGLTLSGCVSAQNEEYARLQTTWQEANAACNATRFPSASAYGRCLDNADAVGPPTMGPDADLGRLFMARRAVIFERLDRRQLTQVQARAELAQLSAELASERQRRNSARQVVAAQQEAAMTASNVALAASRPVTCYRMAYLVNCL